MSKRELKVLASGSFAFLEGPRWHDSRLWFSDMHGDAVWTVDEAGHSTKIVDIPHQPSGLGWLPDGRLLVVSMTDRKILRLEEDGSLVTHADLSGTGDSHLNDMWVAGDGTAYVGEMGVEIDGFLRDTAQAVAEKGPVAFAEAELPGARLFRVGVDGGVSVAAEGLRFPNGATVTDGGKGLVLAETFGLRVSRYDVDEKGGLSNRRVQELGFAPDGMSAPDREGCVWIASPLGRNALRVDAEGKVKDEVSAEGMVIACALGGSDGKTLFLTTSTAMGREAARSARGARIETTSVEVPLASS